MLSRSERRNPNDGRCEDRSTEASWEDRDDAQVDALREGLVLLVQELMEAEVKEKTGAEWVGPGGASCTLTPGRPPGSALNPTPARLVGSSLQFVHWRVQYSNTVDTFDLLGGHDRPPDPLGRGASLSPVPLVRSLLVVEPQEPFKLKAIS